MRKITKILGLLLASIAGLFVLLFALQYLASERVEVVELHAPDETGEIVTTRLWVVDDAGYQYLRVGADGSGWFDRLQASETFELTRGAERGDYRAELRPDKRQQINRLMQEKYTWGDSLIGMLVGSREGSIPVELHPLP